MNGEKPIDLMELAKTAGRAEAEARAQQVRNETVQLVSFTSNRDKGRDIPVGRHPVTNRVVFPDLKRDGAMIKAGETYFCDLVEYRPTLGPSVYYANPIRRVDPSFLFDLHPNQVDQVIAAVMRGSQTQVLQQARAKIRLEIENTTRGQLSVMKADLDSARAENESLRAALSNSKEEIGQTTPRRAGSATHTIESPDVTARPPQLSSEPLAALAQVNRPAADELSSPLLGDGQYFAHVSPDRKKLFVHSHAEGNLLAACGILNIPGLSVLKPFDGKESLRAILDRRVGGMIIDLLG